MDDSIPESIKRCASLLQKATSDLEKIAALFAVVRLVKEDECNLKGKELLFKCIGADFFRRILSAGTSFSDGSECPPHVYKSVALSILGSFCSEPELARCPEMLTIIPVILNIVQEADDDDCDDDDNLIVVSEAYTFLRFISSQKEGQKELVAQGAVSKMAEIYSNQSFKSDEALKILVQLISSCSMNEGWKKDDPKYIHSLIYKVASDFETEQGERKFELCTALQAILHSCDPTLLLNSLGEETWPMSVRKGLSDILSSRIGKDQRDPALKLASAVVQVLGIEWALTDCAKPKQFLLLLIHLSAVEVRMQLEDRTMDQIMKNAELVTACFATLELSVTFIASDVLDLEQKEKQQLYTALKGAFSAILQTLKKIFRTSKSPNKFISEAPPDVRAFTLAVIRILAAWLAQETNAMRAAVFEVLPIILTIANDSFYAYRSWYVSEKVKSPKGAGTSASGPDGDPSSRPFDILRLMLPALCHLTIEEKGREIMLAAKQDETLLECFTFHWSIINYKPPPPPKAERLKMKRPEPLPQSILDQMTDSRAAMVSMCNIFMNIVVLEPRLVETSDSFASLLKFILNNLTDLKRIEENLVLHANMAVLGLLLLKHQSKKVKKNDFSICRYIQTTIRFLWEAYNVDEFNGGEALVVSMEYKKHWLELMELWFLGMQTISIVLSHIPWISEFIIETGWVHGIVEMLSKARVGSLPSNTRHAYEDFLLHLCKTNSAVVPVLKELDILSVCRSHLFMELGKHIFGD